MIRKNIVYKKGAKLKKCRICSIILVPENGSVSYYYKPDDFKGQVKFMKIEADLFNSWNGIDTQCNYCIDRELNK